MSISKKLTQGGQVTLHNLRMLQQVMKVTLTSSFLLSVVVFGTKTWFDYPPYEKYLVGSYYWASFKVEMPFLNKKKVTQDFKDQWGRTIVLRSQDIIEDRWMKNFVSDFEGNVVTNGYLALGSFLLSLMIICGFWVWRGNQRQGKEFRSGTEIVAPTVLTKLIRKRRENSDFQMGGVPLLKNKELQHLLVVGTTGAGKTNAINQLLEQIRNKRQKAIIVDVTGSFVEKFYRPGIDKILNPIDARSESWNIWSDCTESYHFEALANSFLSSKSNDEYWVDSARSLFVTTAKNLMGTPEMITSDFLKYTISSPLYEIEEFYADTSVASFMNQKAEKTAIGIRSTLAVNIKAMELLEDVSSKPDFSIRKWISQEDDDSWLFLVSTPEMREVLKPLITAWVSISTKALMSLRPSSDRRVWFVVDELPALKKIPDLHTMLAEARKYGGCVVLGSQDMPLLDDIYGPNLVRSICNLCSTKLVFRISGSDIAERVSKWIGTQEVSESIENISYGAHQMRDGVSLNTQMKDKAVITADTLMKLDDLQGYLKLPGDYPVTKLVFEYKSYPVVAETFVSRLEEFFENNKYDKTSYNVLEFPHKIDKEETEFDDFEATIDEGTSDSIKIGEN